MAVRYKPEVHDFIRTHLDQFTIQEMAEEVNRRFGTDFNYGKMKAYYNNHKYHTGKRAKYYTDAWPKEIHDFILENYKGTGYHQMIALIKKVQERGYQWDRWKLLHRLVWEENFGPIPEGMIVGFRDLDKKNCSPDNLYLLTLGENALMNKKGFRSRNPELTDVGLATVRLERAVRDRRKKKK